MITEEPEYGFRQFVNAIYNDTLTTEQLMDLFEAVQQEYGNDLGKAMENLK